MIELKLYKYKKNSIFVLDYYETLDISDKLIEEDIPIDRKIEYSEVFKFSVSNINIHLYNDGDSKLESFSYENLKRYVFGLQVIKDGVSKFWGNVNADSVYFNEYSNEIRFTVVDWYKWLVDNIEDIQIPPLTAENCNIIGFLSTLFNYSARDHNYITAIDLSLGTISSDFNYDDYCSLVENKMNAKDFILELQKYYGAFLYFSADRRLKFVNRGRFACSTPKDITNDIYEDEDIEEQRCMPNSYSSILCNVRGNWKINSQGVLELWEGWVFIWWNEEVSTYEWITGVNGDLSNIPNGMKYLDLRQKLTFSGNDFTYSFSNVLFDSRNSVDRFNDYKTVLQKQTRKFYAVDRTDIELQDQIQVFENSKLQVYRIKESLLNETMQLELIEIPDDK